MKKHIPDFAAAYKVHTLSYTSVPKQILACNTVSFEKNREKPYTKDIFHMKRILRICFPCATLGYAGKGAK